MVICQHLSVSRYNSRNTILQKLSVLTACRRQCDIKSIFEISTHNFTFRDKYQPHFTCPSKRQWKQVKTRLFLEPFAMYQTTQFCAVCNSRFVRMMAQIVLLPISEWRAMTPCTADGQFCKCFRSITTSNTDRQSFTLTKIEILCRNRADYSAHLTFWRRNYFF